MAKADGIWHHGALTEFASGNGHPPTDHSHQPSALSPDDRPVVGRVVAVIEVLLCSDVVTQSAIGGTLFALGYRSTTAGGQLSVGYVAALSLGDAILLIGLILALLYAHGERPRDVFSGRRPVAPEGV